MSGTRHGTARDDFFDEQLIAISERPSATPAEATVHVNATLDHTAFASEMLIGDGLTGETLTGETFASASFTDVSLSSESLASETLSSETIASTALGNGTADRAGAVAVTRTRDEASVELADLIARLDLLLRHTQRRRRVTPALQPVHWQTLRYLALCNRFSDTLLALSAWLGATKGTTSQTVTLLERSGLLQRVVDATDRRVMHLQLTAAGQTLLARSMADEFLTTAIEQTALGDSLHAPLTRLLHRWQALLAMPSFGRCGQCRHLARQDEEPYCRRLQARLDPVDQQRACFHHEWPAGEQR